jgi:16S rRNA (cytosine1402-N4)-methyltransferase
MSQYHTPVLLNESLEGLFIKPDGVYVDVTFGGGGHSSAILQQLTTGSLLAFDQDEDALKNADQLTEDFPERSFTFIESNFRYLQKFLRLHGIKAVDGILADLGVSSHQFDVPERGFSTRWDGELDMRMDRNQPLTAREVVNTYEEKDLIHLFSAYGEIKNARTLANAIVMERSKNEIVMSAELKAIAERVAPRGKLMKYLAQVYQAIRIEVNDELGALREFLEQTKDVLKPDGRLVVISYHSLEDRLVKNFMGKGDLKGRETKDFYGNVLRPFDPVNRKIITPEMGEIEKNNRARSAKLRIAARNQWR